VSRLVSVNISTEKGTTKQPVPAISLDPAGIVGDAHAGAWHRQVSLLAQESIEAFGRSAGRSFKHGDFAENLTTEGLDLARVALRDRLRLGAVELEVTQIGKACHGGGCAIYREVGICVMPKEGIFARVITPGELRAGMGITHVPTPLRVQVITVSDRASAGIYADRSGPALQAGLERHFAEARMTLAIELTVVPDEQERIAGAVRAALAAGADAVFTTGGTGIGPRDVTPEAVRPLLERELPGIMDHIRLQHAERLPSALLSRSLAGTVGRSLVYCLPGSPRAVEEYLAGILRSFEHALRMLWGFDGHP
jgi:molybdenum cofactor synthesis domain-containing protein